MTQVSGPIQTGLYSIKSVYDSNDYATLKDAHTGSHLVGTTSDDSDDIKVNL